MRKPNFKKPISSIMAASILALSTIPMSISAAEADLRYDMNLDGVVDFYDAYTLLTYHIDLTANNIIINEDGSFINSSSEVTDEQVAHITENGDLNADSEITSTDASVVLSYYYNDKASGDVSVDGTVNSLDASLVLEYYAINQAGDFNSYYNTAEEANAKYLGDFNGDGNINALDASAILSQYAEAQTA